MTTPTPAKTNGFDPDKTKDFVARIENIHKEMESAKGTYMVECKARREDEKAIYAEAKDAGFPKKSLRAVVNARALERKAEAARDDLGDIDLIDKFDLIRHALGDLADTPLGQAAMPAVRNGMHATA